MDPNAVEEHLRLITETISEVVWVSTWDMSRLIYISPSYERVWGRSCKSLYENPKSFMDGIHPDDLPRVLRDVAMEREGEPVDHEYRIILPDGSERWIWNRGYPVYGPSGKVERYVGVAKDITERKRAETELGALAERFQIVSRATRDAIWDWDIVSNTMWWSEAHYTELEYGRDTPPSYEAWTDRIHPDDRSRVLESLARVVESRGAGLSLEYRFRMPDGSWRNLLDRAYVLHDPSGKPVRMVGAMMDVTLQRSLEAQLRQAQKMEAVGQLAGGIAHDFNNILQALTLQLAILTGTSGLPHSTADILDEIRTTVDRAASVTRQLLVFSRREHMDLRRLDINGAIANIARMLSRIIGEDLKLCLELAPGALHALADAGMLSQVIVNLAVNARDAMPRGGTLTIASSVVDRGDEGGRTPGRYACISVHDTGTGIAADVLPHLFEPFFTTKEPERGTGLGLAIASGIIEQHGGFIDVDSEVGSGSVFRVYLPPAPSATSQASDGAAHDIAGGNETILLVEDDAPSRRLMRGVLEHHGYRVIDAECGRSGLQAWEREHGRIDLVLTDVIMPGGMDGFELAAELEARRPGIKIVFQTGNTLNRAPEAFGSHQTLLYKPIGPQQLLGAIRKRLDETQ